MCKYKTHYFFPSIPSV